MIRKLSIIGLLSISTLASAISITEQENQEKENIKILSNLGLPIPGTGIVVAPRASFDSSEKFLKASANADRERKTLGYVNIDTEQPSELMNIEKTVEQYKKQLQIINSDKSTSMRDKLSDLKLAFTFKPVPKTLYIKYIGATPTGAFNNDGWTGAAEFFTVKNIGTCSYALISIPVSKMSMTIAEEAVSYDINNKISLIETSGNKKSGFIYNIQWYDDEYFHELECANMNFSRKIIQSGIELAKNIDNA